MTEDFKTLINALSIFNEEYDLDRVQNIGSLKMSIKNGYIDFITLYSEYLNALNDTSFDWVSLSEKSNLLTNSGKYEQKEIRDYIKYLLNGFILPESKLSKEALNKLIVICMMHLSKLEEDAWLESDKLWNLVKEVPQFEDLDYYQLYFIWPNSNYRIERKFIPDKEILIGDFRNKKNDVESYFV